MKKKTTLKTLTKSVPPRPPKSYRQQTSIPFLTPSTIFLTIFSDLTKFTDTNLHKHSLYNYFRLDGFRQSIPGYQHHCLSRTLHLSVSLVSKCPRSCHQPSIWGHAVGRAVGSGREESNEHCWNLGNRSFASWWVTLNTCSAPPGLNVCTWACSSWPGKVRLKPYMS